MTANVRLLFATNENLDKAVECGRFRPDLYYRIKVINVRVPTAQGKAGGNSSTGKAVREAIRRRILQSHPQIFGCCDGASNAPLMAWEHQAVGKRSSAT